MSVEITSCHKSSCDHLAWLILPMDVTFILFLCLRFSRNTTRARYGLRQGFLSLDRLLNE